MTDIQRRLIAIAKLALEAVDLEVSPPPATEPEPPKPARKVKRKQPRNPLKGWHAVRQGKLKAVSTSKTVSVG